MDDGRTIRWDGKDRASDGLGSRRDHLSVVAYFEMSVGVQADSRKEKSGREGVDGGAGARRLQVGRCT